MKPLHNKRIFISTQGLTHETLQSSNSSVTLLVSSPTSFKMTVLQRILSSVTCHPMTRENLKFCNALALVLSVKVIIISFFVFFPSFVSPLHTASCRRNEQMCTQTSHLLSASSPVDEHLTFAREPENKRRTFIKFIKFSQRINRTSRSLDFTRSTLLSYITLKLRRGAVRDGKHIQLFVKFKL